MTWSKAHPGLGTYRCRGQHIVEDEIIVLVYEAPHDPNVQISPGGLPEGGIKLRVIQPESYMAEPGAPTTFGHMIYRGAYWAPYEES